MIHDVDRGLAVLDADVDVQAEDEVGARHQLHVFDDVLVALVGVDFLDAPIAERMGGPGREPQPVFPGQAHHVAPQCLYFRLGFLDVFADRGAYLDDGLVQFGLDALLQEELALFQNFGVNVRSQIAGDRIDCLILLFNPDGKGRRHRSTNAGDSSGYFSSLARKWEVRAGTPAGVEDSIAIS